MSVERLQAAFRTFRTSQLTVNRFQVQALGDLMWDGTQAGDAKADPPPRSVALCGLDPIAAFDTLDRHRDGSHAVDGEGMVPFVTVAAGHTLGVLAEDGRTWSIVAEGIAWPNTANGGQR